MPRGLGASAGAALSALYTTAWHDDTTLCTHSANTYGTVPTSADKMPRKSYTPDWLGDEDELMDYYDENESPAYCEDEEYFYDGHGMRHTSADMRSHCTDKPTSGEDAHGHSQYEGQESVELGLDCVYNDNEAQDQSEAPDVPDVLPEPLAAMLAGLRQLPTDGYRPNPPEALYTYKDDEFSSELNEMFSRFDILRTLGPDPVRFGYDSALSEPEEKEVVAVCLLATLHKCETNIDILGEPRVDRNHSGRR